MMGPRRKGSGGRVRPSAGANDSPPDPKQRVKAYSEYTRLKNKEAAQARKKKLASAEGALALLCG